jgi:hypothetical protein
MRREKVPEKKSARLEKKRKVPTPSVSPWRGELFAEVEIEDCVLVTPPGETSSTPRSGSSDLNPDRQDPEPEGEATGSEEETMTRLKYKRFKGDGHQDVDDWFSEFESTAVANQEEDEAKQRIFQGLLKGEALKWYQDIPVSAPKPFQGSVGASGSWHFFLSHFITLLHMFPSMEVQ